MKTKSTSNRRGNRKLSGVKLIAMERRRQLEKEKWSAAHDDGHEFGELANAAACYALTGDKRCREVLVNRGSNQWTGMQVRAFTWPWDVQWWKPTPANRIRELTKSGALIAAEIDRLLRAKSNRR